MIKNAEYSFEDISVILNTSSNKLLEFIAEYTNFSRAPASSDFVIQFAFHDNADPESFYSQIPSNAKLEHECSVMLNGERTFRLYTRDGNERWLIYDDYGMSYTNLKDNIINSYYCSESDISDITPFIIFFNHPIVKFMQNCGYYFLHAACAEVLGKNILITGLSGRGKSTAAFALSNNGHAILTDETSLLKNKNGMLSAYTISNWMKLGSNSIKYYDGRSLDEKMICGNEYIVKLSAINKKPLKKLDEITHVFIIEQTGKSETFIEKVNALAVVPEMLPVSLNLSSRKRTEEEFGFMLDLLKSVSCYKIFFGTDMKQFAREVEKTVMREIS